MRLPCIKYEFSSYHNSKVYFVCFFAVYILLLSVEKFANKCSIFSICFIRNNFNNFLIQEKSI
jgi:hypothetical protein